MNYKISLSRLPELLLPWYLENKRDLPWRADRNPYHIWLSEIMLQQTRVEAVKGYYTRFLDTLPTIEALSQCDDEVLHKLWEGLGYYSRVRNLKKAAQQIMDIHNGEFPRTHDQVIALPGIGAYTAGAICSIAFNLPTPAVDGNVLRVFSRLTNDPSPIDLPATKQNVSDALAEIYPQQAGNFTQALMELGA
ncbi:MAG: A/G-specific adenine glycosylase, partial [Oscillospiraceae bacterium]|nr:A/G-specific adenine glycosylase [Oscillospiraceae bacterium]